MLYDTLAAGEILSGIDVQVYTASNEGTEIVNLRVASMGNPALRDSINVYVNVQAGAKETSLHHLSDATHLQVHPNPFWRKTKIKWQTEENVTGVNIYDARGRLVKQFDCTTMRRSHVVWYGTDDSDLCVPAGVYFVKLVSENQATIQNVVLLRSGD